MAKRVAEVAERIDPHVDPQKTSQTPTLATRLATLATCLTTPNHKTRHQKISGCRLIALDNVS